MPPKKSDKSEPEKINTYGHAFYPDLDQLAYDRLAFSKRTPIEAGAPQRLELFKRITDKMLPNHFEWHSWAEKMVGAMCEHPIVAFPGCANSGKTFTVTSFAFAWWMMRPEISSVILVTTSKGAMKQRAWPEVMRCYTRVPGPRIGNLVRSRLALQAMKGDDKHAIIGKAVEEGPVDKVADDIKGVHTRRQMVIIDEATAVPQAIWEACGNLYSYPEEFLLVCMGNPKNRLDQFGRICEPEGGWLSVNVDSDEWEGRPQAMYGGAIPHIVRLDAEKSPNIVEGKVVSKHLPTKERVEAAKFASKGETPSYWQNTRGFWPPEGLTKTVFTESAIVLSDGYGKMKFTGRDFIILSSFDPARSGGDRAAWRPAKFGEIEGGKFGLELCPPIIIPLDAKSTNPIDYQLTEQVRRQCEKVIIGGVEYYCLPENLIIDDTGDGGLCDIMQRTWSPKIVRVKFSWAASEDAVSLEDVRPSNEVYENKRVEMHFRARDAMNHGQLKGMDKDSARELCNLRFDDSGKRIKLMKKADYKEEFGYSPDFGDTVVMLIELARQKGFRLAPQGQTVTRHNDFNEFVNKAQEVYTSGYEPEED